MKKSTPEKFKNKMALLLWMQGLGYKIQKSKLYQDITDGALQWEKDGTVPARNLVDYLEAVPREVKEDSSNRHTEKTEKEIEHLDLKNEKLQFELDKERGKYVLKKDAEMAMALRGATLKAGVEHLLNTKFRHVVGLVSGDANKMQAGVDYLQAGFEELLNDFARADLIEVEIED